MREKPTIFLSSTINDLKKDRTAIFNFIKEQMNFEIFASEKEGADWISSNEKCMPIRLAQARLILQDRMCLSALESWDKIILQIANLC